MRSTCLFCIGWVPCIKKVNSVLVVLLYLNWRITLILVPFPTLNLKYQECSVMNMTRESLLVFLSYNSSTLNVYSKRSSERFSRTRVLSSVFDLTSDSSSSVIRPIFSCKIGKELKILQGSVFSVFGVYFSYCSSVPMKLCFILSYFQNIHVFFFITIFHPLWDPF